MNKKGFTLIELLVVIAIIGILSTLAVVSLSGAREKANDAKIKSDLNQIATVAETYYADASTYPDEDYIASSTSALGSAPSGCGTTDYTYELYAGAGSFIAYHELCTDETQFWCVDNSGNRGVVSSTPSGNATCQ